MSDDHGHAHGGESDAALRTRAIESLLIEKGLVDPAALDELIETYEHKVGPHHGARVVARAWSDPSFKEWLLRDPNAAIASLGYRGRQGEHPEPLYSVSFAGRELWADWGDPREKLYLDLWESYLEPA